MTQAIEAPGVVPVPSGKRGKRERPKLTILAWAGLVIVVGSALMAVLGPFVAPDRASAIVTDTIYAGAGDGVGIMGADTMGRDVFSRLLHGAHLTIGIALIANILGFILGMAVGFAAAEIRGRTDDFVTWLVDVFLAFPPIMFAFIVIAALGSNMYVLVGTIAVVSAPRIARVSRAVAMNVAVLDFVEVARARGESLYSVLVREIMPNTVRPLAVEFGLRLTFAILLLASLSFLGLGIQPPAADWGSMVKENLSGIVRGSPAALFPAAAIGVLTIGINLLVDWAASQSGRSTSEELA